MITCELCGQVIKPFADWFSEDCPAPASANGGHSLSWEKRLQLPFYDITGKLHDPATPTKT